jgi:membrane protease YdiL (CAAX protease family)
MLGFPMWTARRRSGAFPALPKLRAVFREARWLPLLVPCVVAILILVQLTIVALFGEAAVSVNGWEPVARSSTWFEQLFLGVIGLLVAPLAEEVCFRGMLYNKLRQRLPVLVAAAIQATLFGLLHPFGLDQSFVIGLIGMALALVYEWRKTLLAPVLLHASINGVATIVLAWTIAADAGGPKLGLVGETRNGEVVVTHLTPGGAVERAGLHAGDLIVSVDGARVSDFNQLRKFVRGKRVGDKVTVKFSRDGNTQQVQVTLTPLPK